MPWRARPGASTPPGAAWVANSGGTGTRSSSPFRKASQRGCASSMIANSTRSIIGSRRPRKRSAIAWPARSPAAGVSS